MKKIVFMVLLLLILNACSNHSQEPLQQLSEGSKRFTEPIVTVNGEKVVLIHGTPRPEELVKNVVPQVVPSSSPVRIDFADRPEGDHMRIVQWFKGKESSIEIHEDQTFTLPKKEGIYVFQVFVRWSDLSQSLDSHTFIVQVRDRESNR